MDEFWVADAAWQALDIYKESMVTDDSDDDRFIEFAIQVFEHITGRNIGQEIVKEQGV